uniref:AlNc14C87G5573 protein n=1 Tax=Albugo laibachii Nc14 TaxID=890382 RepID=F0WG43_9STRA|nr:AlNc14C87G5573 [Albugo laibachii Nc14]|eukprot:CCA20178.1 AlNc14C87G5573 [Albugo laibachii Nc14]
MVNATATQTELIVLIEQSKRRLEEKRRPIREGYLHNDETDGLNADLSDSSQAHLYEKAIRTSYDTLKKRDLNSYSSTPLYFSWDRASKHEGHTQAKRDGGIMKEESRVNGTHNNKNGAGMPTHRTPKSFSQVQMSGRKTADCDRSVASTAYPMWQKSSRKLDGYNLTRNEKKKASGRAGGKDTHQKSTMWSVDCTYSSDENVDSKNIIEKRDNAINQIRKLQARLDAKLYVLEKRTFGHHQQHETTSHEPETKHTSTTKDSMESPGEGRSFQNGHNQSVLSLVENEKHSNALAHQYRQFNSKGSEKIDEMRDSNGLIERIMLENGISPDSQDNKSEPTNLSNLNGYDKKHGYQLENRQRHASRTNNHVSGEDPVSGGYVRSKVAAATAAELNQDVSEDTASSRRRGTDKGASDPIEVGDGHHAPEFKHGNSSSIKSSKAATSSRQRKKTTDPDVNSMAAMKEYQSARSRQATNQRTSPSFTAQSDLEIYSCVREQDGHEPSHGAGEAGTTSDSELEGDQSNSESDQEIEIRSTRQRESDQESTKVSEVRSANVENASQQHEARKCSHEIPPQPIMGSIKSFNSEKQLAKKDRNESKELNATADHKDSHSSKHKVSKRKQDHDKRAHDMRVQPADTNAHKVVGGSKSVSTSDDSESDSDFELVQEMSDVKTRPTHDADRKKHDKVKASHNPQFIQVRPVQLRHEHSTMMMKTNLREKRRSKDANDKFIEKETHPTEIDSEHSSSESLQTGNSEIDSSEDMSDKKDVTKVSKKRRQKTRRSQDGKASLSIPDKMINSIGKGAASSVSSLEEGSSNDATETESPPICWPSGMEKIYRESLTHMNSLTHSFAPPRIKHFRGRSQLKQYWLWLHWYSAWQLSYMQEDSTKPQKKRSSQHTLRVRKRERHTCHDT